MMICTPGDFVTAYALGVVTVIGLYISWKLWRIVQHANKQADRNRRNGSRG